jgi:hypothetical protein
LVGRTRSGESRPIAGPLLHGSVHLFKEWISIQVPGLEPGRIGTHEEKLGAEICRAQGTFAGRFLGPNKQQNWKAERGRSCCPGDVGEMEGVGHHLGGRSPANFDQMRRFTPGWNFTQGQHYLAEVPPTLQFTSLSRHSKDGPNDWQTATSSMTSPARLFTHSQTINRFALGLQFSSSGTRHDICQAVAPGTRLSTGTVGHETTRASCSSESSAQAPMDFFEVGVAVLVSIVLLGFRQEP